MAGDKGSASYDALAERLNKIIHSGSRVQAIEDFVCRELRKIPHYTWVGIYSVQGSDLVLTAWSGPAATQHVRIQVGQGICGAAASSREVITVPDVDKDPRYLQCFLNTRSEIVVPVLRESVAVAEIDIDSDKRNAFGSADERFLKRVAGELARVL